MAAAELAQSCGQRTGKPAQIVRFDRDFGLHFE